ncbi:hypothetical protein [Streptomyces griseoluteus]|uniref:hypothetical protein n=1 Tax=Streptomyces griseoluteus TaxID=29306 RepID=UPI00142EDDEE|nr:hypothetical protein [Streptomyces griseoluteus]
MLGHRRLLVGDDDVRTAPHGGGVAVVVRSFSRTTTPARTARSYWSGMRGISHSPAS